MYLHLITTMVLQPPLESPLDRDFASPQDLIDSVEAHAEKQGFAVAF